MKHVVFSLALLTASADLASAEDRVQHAFTKKQLSNIFYSEGAGVGDFNKDGKLDVVAGPFWYAGPEFTQKHEIYPAKPFDKHNYSDNFFAWGSDVNKDGWDDVFIVGFPGLDGSWWENPAGKNEPWKRHKVVQIVDNESPQFTDITGDGIPDSVCSEKGQYGYSSADPADPARPWKFHPISERSDYQRFTHGMGVGDVNGDGKMDLLAKDGWWEQPAEKADSTLWKKHPFNFAGPGGAQMYAYDFDGDGDNDVLTSLAAHAYGLVWYEQVKNDGKIDFKQHRILGDKAGQNPYGVVFSQLHAIDLIDMDGDGVKDIVTGKRHWAHGPKGDPDSMGPAVLYWFKTVRGKDGVDFIPYLIDDNSGVGTQVLATDVNGDGLPEVIVGNKLGAFIHLHEAKKVSEEDWQKAQPKKKEGSASIGSPLTPVNAEVVEDVKEKPKVQGAGKKAQEWVTKVLAERKGGAAGREEGIVPSSEEGKPLNLGFETGTLQDWLASGEAFKGQPIEGDSVAARRSDMKSRHVGKFWVGTYEKNGDDLKGTLTSRPFKVSHPYASFLVGGGSHRDTRVEVVSQDTQQPILRAFGENSENMRAVLVDLTKHVGKEIFVRVVDEQAGGWGHVNFDDFRFHPTKPNVQPPSVLGKEDVYTHAGLDPQKAAEVMTVPKGFSVKLFAAEPDVRQPVAFTIDDRGRLWVLECYTYPQRAPEGEGKDRILIFEDSDGDGKFDAKKTFVENLNFSTGLEIGFGGVFVGSPPYLHFIPDKDGDDKPDGPPEVLLDGWGYQDTHETLNSFNWGPDGWLYGCHGVFTHSKVGKPGTPDDQRAYIDGGIWRYHPTKKEFEVFAHGTSNPWGVDFNDRGQCFLTCCVIPHLFHVIQDARYTRQSGRHVNPYTYADIPTIAKHRHWIGPGPHAGNNRSADAGGGHAHSGALIYLGGVWPAKYRDQIFMNNIHGARINQDKLAVQGSGYVGDRAPDFLEMNDKWSQVIALRTGPDGNVYMIDWYDANQCHLPVAAMHDRRNGRVYKISYEGTEPIRGVDLRKKTDAELVELQLHSNDWYVRQARRILQERSAKGIDEGAKQALVDMAVSHKDETRRLRGLWALHVTGGLSDEVAQKTLTDESPYVRGWTIQLILEDRMAKAEQLAQLASLAKEDPSPVVRLYLTSAAHRVPSETRWGIAEGLLSHSEDGADHNLPLMNWYAFEPLVRDDPQRALELASQCRIEPILSFTVRRIGQLGTPAALEQLVAGLGKADREQAQLDYLQGINIALAGRRRVDMPAAWPTVAKKLAGHENASIRAQREALAVTFGDAQVLGEMKETLLDKNADPDRRLLALSSLLGVKEKGLAGPLQQLIADQKLRGPALRGLAQYDDAKTPDVLLSAFASLDLAEKRDALNTLAARPVYARRLLDAVRANKISAADLSADLVRQLRNLGDAEVQKGIGEVWGVVRESPEEKAKLIAQYQKMLSSRARQTPDVSLGRAVFAKTCAQCHKMFGTGGTVGPEITGSNRANLEYLLSNVLDPSAVMPKEYVPTIFALHDGRVVIGIVKGETDAAWTVVTANETVVLPKSEVDDRKVADKSMMPGDLFKPLSEHEVRSLVRYLASPSQTPLLANADNVKNFFAGVDLAGWTGNPKLWKVENGEIVGTSPGINHNEFLKSDLSVEDFRLTLKIKLTPNAGNSGIQFRSEVLPDGTVKGYQADAGEGWWGKLYEEHARGLLSTVSGEAYVKYNEWNDYEIVAVGSKIRTSINGRICTNLDDPAGAKRGIIALQIHAGPAMEVRFKDLRLELNPKPALAQSP